MLVAELARCPGRRWKSFSHDGDDDGDDVDVDAEDSGYFDYLMTKMMKTVTG